MRVIGGSERGRKLVSLEGSDTRPTLDRVKEAMFNIVQSKTYGANVLDLFAGSGALGIEAISRGAARVAFNDSSKSACKIIDINISNLKISDKSQIYTMNWQDFIKKALQNHDFFDIIIVDAPYDNDYIYECINACKNLLNPGGVIIAEHDGKTSFTKDVIKTKKYGAVYLTLLGEKNE